MRIIQKVFLATEITGLGDDAQIIEIAVCDIDGKSLINTRVRPTVPVEAGATAVHGIRTADLADAPTWPEVEPELWEAIEGNQVIIFNAKFGLRLLKQTMAAHHSPRVEDVNKLDVRCAMEEAAQEYGGYGRYNSFSLANALRAARIPQDPEDAHSAYADARDTASLIKEMGHDRIRWDGRVPDGVAQEIRGMSPEVANQSAPLQVNPAKGKGLER